MEYNETINEKIKECWKLSKTVPGDVYLLQNKRNKSFRFFRPNIQQENLKVLTHEDYVILCKFNGGTREYDYCTNDTSVIKKLKSLSNILLLTDYAQVAVQEYYNDNYESEGIKMFIDFFKEHIHICHYIITINDINHIHYQQKQDLGYQILNYCQNNNLQFYN